MFQHYHRDLFLASAPRRPYCADDLGAGLRIRPIEAAFRHRYIQHNPPHLLAFLVFDIDRPGAALAAEDAGLAAPNWIAETPASRRGHLGYALAFPVLTTSAARLPPLRFAAAVEQGYRDALRADPGYSGLITKTPGHEAWNTYWGRPQPYTLEELAEYLPELPKVRRTKAAEAVGLMRNVTLFNSLRTWAYRERLRYDDNAAWHSACLSYAEGVNAGFVDPLPPSEVKATAKSVAKWTWQRITHAGLSAIQRVRGQRRGAALAAERMDRLQRVLEFNR